MKAAKLVQKTGQSLEGQCGHRVAYPSERIIVADEFYCILRTDF
jgi:hypothetical protein